MHEHTTRLWSCTPPDSTMGEEGLRTTVTVDDAHSLSQSDMGVLERPHNGSFSDPCYLNGHGYLHGIFMVKPVQTLPFLNNIAFFHLL